MLPGTHSLRLAPTETPAARAAGCRAATGRTAWAAPQGENHGVFLGEDVEGRGFYVLTLPVFKVKWSQTEASRRTHPTTHGSQLPGSSPAARSARPAT